MPYFDTSYARVAFIAFAIGYVTALLIFVREVCRRDEEYERFMAWPLRLLFYAILCPIMPPFGIGVGVWGMYRGDTPHRKLAHGAIFISIVYLCFDFAVFLGMGLR